MEQNAKTHLPYLKQLQVAKFNEIEQYISSLFNEIVDIQYPSLNNKFLMNTMIFLHHDFMNFKTFFDKIFTETYINDIQRFETMDFITHMLNLFLCKIRLITNLKQFYFDKRIMDISNDILNLNLNP